MIVYLTSHYARWSIHIVTSCPEFNRLQKSDPMPCNPYLISLTLETKGKRNCNISLFFFYLYSVFSRIITYLLHKSIDWFLWGRGRGEGASFVFFSLSSIELNQLNSKLTGGEKPTHKLIFWTIFGKLYSLFISSFHQFFDYTSS